MMSLSVWLPGPMSLLGVCLQEGVLPTGGRGCWWYASYWNALLFTTYFITSRFPCLCVVLCILKVHQINNFKICFLKFAKTFSTLDKL